MPLYQTDYNATQLRESSTPTAEEILLSSLRRQTHLVVDKNPLLEIYTSLFDQTPFYSKLKGLLQKQLSDEFSRMELTSNAIKKNITDFVLTASDKIKRIPYRDISVKLLTDDTIKINVNYNDDLQIVIIRAFEENDDDDHTPLVTLLEKNKIAFQNRITINNLVKSFLVAIK